MKWDDKGWYVPDENPKPPVKSGEVPDGEYQSGNYMVITYCCRRDEFHTKPMHLPIGEILTENFCFISNCTLLKVCDIIDQECMRIMPNRIYKSCRMKALQAKSCCNQRGRNLQVCIFLCEVYVFAVIRPFFLSLFFTVT